MLIPGPHSHPDPGRDSSLQFLCHLSGQHVLQYQWHMKTSLSYTSNHLLKHRPTLLTFPIYILATAHHGEPGFRHQSPHCLPNIPCLGHILSLLGGFCSLSQQWLSEPEMQSFLFLLKVLWLATRHSWLNKNGQLIKRSPFGIATEELRSISVGSLT